MLTETSNPTWGNDYLSENSYASPSIEGAHYFSIGMFKEKELLRFSFPQRGGQNLRNIIKQEDGHSCLIFRHSNGIVTADSQFSLMQAPDADLPVNLMNVFFRQGNAVLVGGPYVFSDSVKLDQFSVREVSDYSPEKRQMEILTRNALERYFSGNESFSFQRLKDSIADPNCGLPGLHRDAVMGLLKI